METQTKTPDESLGTLAHKTLFRVSDKKAHFLYVTEVKEHSLIVCERPSL